jgi:CTP:molybdopterin cytidylyltransferase MocA
MPRAEALVLAAGLSERMGGFKPLLPLAGKTALERCVALFQEAGVESVRVVAGHRAEEVEAAARMAGAAAVRNPDFTAGMFSSVRAGVAALDPEAEVFFVLPVDIPLVRPSTVRRLLETAESAAGGDSWDILYPTFWGERGHPPLIRAGLAPAILGHAGKGGLRRVLAEREERAWDLPVADAGVLRDMDLARDYAAAQERAERLDIPTDEEIAVLWDLAGTPMATREHCRAVARAAAGLCAALARAGAGVDEALAQAAALLHDVAKGSRSHEAAGAAFLDAHGFARVAAVVAAHRDLRLGSGAAFTAREVVFLADKLVRGVEPAPLELRYQEKLEQWAHDPVVHAEISGRLDRARAVRASFESVAGIELEQAAREGT